MQEFACVPQLADRHKVLIADTAGFGNRSTVICIGAADGVLVPATPGEGDIVEAQKMVTFVHTTGRTLGEISKPACWQTGSGAAPLCPATCCRRSRLWACPGSIPRCRRRLPMARWVLPATGQAAAEIAALVTELLALEWLPPITSRANM
jgi:hypothetical protein